MIALAKIKPVLLTSLFLGMFFLSYELTLPPKQHTTPTIGNTSTLISAYDRWKAQKIKWSNIQTLNLPLTVNKAHAKEAILATGLATIDLQSGILDIKTSGLKKQDTFDVWLIDNESKSDNSKQKNQVYLGQLQQQKGSSELQVSLNRSDLIGFKLSHLVISRTGQNPAQQSLMAGSPTLFQKLFYSERRLMKPIPSAQQLAMMTTKSQSDPLLPFAFLLPTPAFAQQATSSELTALVAQGEDLFFNETFNGNGRTCGTCHRAENNLTIDPAFIATLPPDDPLFVAEFNSDLAELEDPALMREYGLIRANVDGLEDPANKFVMRSVPHMLGMSLSIQSVATEAPFEMTGWAGDGAPGNGTLRDFATGAVIQHFTKTLDRVEDEDFRLPSEAELDAIEAFTLSLGRQSEMNFETMQLVNSTAEKGRVLFITEDSQNRTVQAAKCNICHRNGGALTIAGVNQNFETGIQNMPHPAVLAGNTLPADDGFGRQFNPATGGFGDHSFNTASIIEAADTAPYFHNNSATTLEDAIAFYGSADFTNSIEGQRLMLQDSGGQELSVEVDDLAAFLRVINALENIRSVNDFVTRAKLGITVADSQKLLTLAGADLEDAVQVLNASELHVEDAIPSLEEAQSLVDEANNVADTAERDNLIEQVLAKTQEARAFMVVDSGPDITKPVLSILSPATGSTVSGQVIISADASDNVAIEQLIFIIDGTEIGRLAAAPFNQTWDTTTFADGSYQLTVIAQDFSGNSQSASINLDVNNTPAPDTTKPTVTILSPGAGATVSGQVTISVNAFDNTGIEKVIFKIGTQKIGQDFTAPYQQTWDSSAFADGIHTVKVIAVDLVNNRKVAKVDVTVNNAPVVCTVYSCPNPPPPPTEPPPPPVVPVTPDSSPDGEFEGEILSKDVAGSSVTVSTGNGPVTLKITSATEFVGNIAMDFHSILVGHIVQGEFFTSVNEALWIEADLPPGF